MKDPVYERRTRITMQVSAGWTLNFPPALYCDGKCSACIYRMYTLLDKCNCSMIVLCGDALPDEGLANRLETKAWIQYQQGLITPNPGGASEGWKFYWSPERMQWVRHYY